MQRVSTRVDLGAYPLTLVLAAVTCALTPAYTLRWHAGFYPTTVLEDAILLTLAAFAVESWRLKAMPLWRTPFTWPAAIFLVAGAISVIVPPDHRSALGIYRAYLIEPIAFFFVLNTVARQPKHALIVAIGLAAAGIVVGIANAAVVLDAVRHHTLNVAVTGPVVIYTNANDVALFLVPLIAIAGSLLLFSSDPRVRIVSGVFLVVAVSATILSLSRGGYLALAAVAIGLAIAHRRRWLLLGGAGAAAVVLLLIPSINRRVAIEIDLSNGDNTLVGRSHLWSASLQMLQHHIPFGAGLAGFSNAVAPYWNPTHPDRFIYPHNIVLTFWSETGLLGLAAFAWILVTGFTVAWRGQLAADPAWRPIHLGVFLALVAVVLHGLVDVPYFKNDLALEFWAILGLASAGTGLAAGIQVTRGGGLLERFLADRRSRQADRLIPSSARSGRILDVGCGTYPLFLTQTKFAERYGLDREVAPDVTGAGMRLIGHDLGAAGRLPFDDGFFDVVTMLAVFEHLDRPVLLSVLREIRRILRGGGIYVMTTPASWTEDLLRVMSRLGLVSHEEVSEHKAQHTGAQIAALLNEAGFESSAIDQGSFELGMNLWARARKTP